MSDSRIRAQNIILRPTTANATDSTSAGVDLTGMAGYSIQCIVTGSDVAGAVKLQVSDDNAAYIDLVSSSQSLTSSAGYMYTYAGQQYRYVRAVWTHSSGTGNVTIIFYFNGVQ